MHSFDPRFGGRFFCSLLEKRDQAFETKCLRKLLCISCLEHKTNEWTRSKINFLVGPQEPLLVTVKRRKLAWFGHVTRHDSLFKTILQGILEGGQRRDRTGNAGWISKSGHLCPCQNCSQWPPVEKIGRGSLLNRPLCPPEDLIGQGTELN